MGKILTSNEKLILRDLAKQYLEICKDPIQDELRNLWKKHNSLKETRPLIYVRAFAWQEMSQSKCIIEDAFFRRFEDFFRYCLFWSALGDDSIFELWITVQATRKCTGWGVYLNRKFSQDPRGSYKIDYPIKVPSDIEKLRMPWHEIDEEKTSLDVSKLNDVIGNIITINVDRGPFYRMWAGDISNILGQLRGIEYFMMDMIDNPDWLKTLVKFIADGILKTHNEAEIAGDWGLSNHENQSMPYAEELPAPAANVNGVKRKNLWAFMAAQEFVSVSPSMHEEFLLNYQIPILEKFGLVAYGCCEDLSNKIDMLRKIPNLRRIAVSPFANVEKCAEQIQRDYVLSYRPSPSEMVGYGFDPDKVRSILKKDMKTCKNTFVDITLKDVETVQCDPERVKKWVKICHEVIEEIF